MEKDVFIYEEDRVLWIHHNQDSILREQFIVHYLTRGDVLLGDWQETKEYFETLANDTETEMIDCDSYLFESIQEAYETSDGVELDKDAIWYLLDWAIGISSLEDDEDDEEKLKRMLSEEMDESFGLEGYTEYIMDNFGSAIEVYRRGGNMYDLDALVELKAILGFDVSYELYHFIDGQPEMEDRSYTELGKSDYDMLMQICVKYARGGNE